MENHEYDEEIPNHHLPPMSDHQNNSGHLSHHSNPNLDRNFSGHHSHHSNPKLPDFDPGHHNYPLSGRRETINPNLDRNSSGHLSHHSNPKLADFDHNPSGRRQNSRPPSHNGRPIQFSPLPPPAGPPYNGKHNRHQPQYSPPPPPPYNRGERSSKTGPFAAIATLLLLAAIAALTLYLIYRPKTPHFTVVAASIYLLNTTTPTTLTLYGPPPPPTASFLAASLQFTVVTRNSHRHTSLYYDRLTAQVFYRDQPITPPTGLPPLIHTHRSTVVFSTVLGGGGVAMPVAPGVVEGVVADEAYGAMAMRLVMMGRIRYKAGIIKTAHYGVYVGCDVLLGVKKAVYGPVPLLATHECKVDL